MNLEDMYDVLATQSMQRVTIKLVKDKLTNISEPYKVFLLGEYGNDETVFSSSDKERAELYYKAFCEGFYKGTL